MVMNIKDAKAILTGYVTNMKYILDTDPYCISVINSIEKLLEHNSLLQLENLKLKSNEIIKKMPGGN